MPDLDVSLTEDAPGSQSSPISGAAEKEFFNMDQASHEHKMRQLELGWIGRPFGGGAEKAGNIAILTIGICLTVSLVIACRADVAKDSELLIKDLSPFLSIVTLALGYIFGAGKAK
jgi:hypothetical protein